MTLCLAWKHGNAVYFASDSRLTATSKSILTEEATKIFKVGVEIYGPNDSEFPNAPEELIYHSTFGLCFAGSYLNGSLLADTLDEVLSNIQVAPGYSDFTIENLSNISFSIYKQVSKQIMAINREQGFAKVLLGGFCPVYNTFRLYEFSTQFNTAMGMYDFIKNEIELNTMPVFIGDQVAIEYAKTLLYKIGEQYSAFHLLREIIDNSEITTVGGDIQCGVFAQGKFRTYGIVEYDTIENDYGFLEVQHKYKFRGLDLNLNAEELRSGQINISKTFLNPFERERNELFKKVVDRIEKNI